MTQQPYTIENATGLKHFLSDWMQCYVKYDSIMGWTIGRHDMNYERIISQQYALRIIALLKTLRDSGPKNKLP